MNVRMKNGLAVVQFGDQETIYEYTGGDYVAGQSATPIRHPGGVAISGNSVLIGGDGCDYDAVVYQKAPTDSGASPADWTITRPKASAAPKALRWSSTITTR